MLHFVRTLELNVRYIFSIAAVKDAKVVGFEVLGCSNTYYAIRLRVLEPHQPIAHYFKGDATKTYIEYRFELVVREAEFSGEYIATSRYQDTEIHLVKSVY